MTPLGRRLRRFCSSSLGESALAHLFSSIAELDGAGTTLGFNRWKRSDLSRFEKPDGGRKSTERDFLGSDFRWGISRPAAGGRYGATELHWRFANQGREWDADVDRNKHLHRRNDHRGRNPPTRQWWNERSVASRNSPDFERRVLILGSQRRHLSSLSGAVFTRHSEHVP